MSNHSDTEKSRAIVARFYEAALSDDFAKAVTVLHPAFAIHEPSFLPFGGVTTGIEAFAQLLGRIAQFIDFSTLRLESIMADGAVVVAFFSGRSRKDQLLSIAERSVVQDDMIREMRVFYHDVGDFIPRTSY